MILKDLELEDQLNEITQKFGATEKPIIFDDNGCIDSYDSQVLFDD